MKNLSSTAAYAAIHPILARVISSNPLSPADRQTIIDATDHPDPGVVSQAFSVIKHVEDKSPFETVLIKHAMDHSKPACAFAAYKAMTYAQDMTPFYPAIVVGCKATHRDIALGALSPLFFYVMYNNSLLPRPC